MRALNNIGEAVAESVNEYLSSADVKIALHVAPQVMEVPYSTANMEMFKTYKVLREASNWIYDVLY